MHYTNIILLFGLLLYYMVFFIFSLRIRFSYPKEEILFITCVAGFFLGIFKECHKVVPPEPFFESCVFDMCATGGEVVALCQAIESYADMCAANGVPINWRDSKFCRKSVNKNMIFVDGLISL